MSYYSTYRWCAVPECKNTSVKTPDKLWIRVPTVKNMRKTWFKVARRDPELLSEKTRMYFCEDHFDLEHDMENYTQYKIMGSVKRIRLKPDCIPTRFGWNRKHKSASNDSHFAEAKRLRLSITEDSVQDHIGESQTAVDVPSMKHKCDKAVEVIQAQEHKDLQQRIYQPSKSLFLRNTELARVAAAPLPAGPRPRGAALVCGPIKVTSGPLTLGSVNSDFNPVITRIKSEADPIKQEEDPQSDDTLSLAEDTDQLSDPDQPSEDLISLSNTQVPVSNAPDPLSDVKVEELEVGVDEVEITGPEDVNRPVELTRAVEVPAVPLPLHLRQELSLAGNDCYKLIRIQANQINKLSVRCKKQRQKLHSYVQIVSRRNKKISDLQTEVEALRNFIGKTGSEASSIGGGKLDSPRIQIQSSNSAVVEKKPNRQLLIVNRDPNRPKALVSAQPTSDILQKPLLDALNTSDDRQNLSVGVKRTLNIQEKSSVGVKRTSVNLQKSSSGIPGTSNVLQKSSVGLQSISDIIIQKSPVGCQRSSGIRQKSSAGVKRNSDILNNPSVAVQPISVVPQTSPVGFQRTSDIGQNALVIQIDGMHHTMLQPKLVRLEDNSMETG